MEEAEEDGGRPPESVNRRFEGMLFDDRPESERPEPVSLPLLSLLPRVFAASLELPLPLPLPLPPAAPLPPLPPRPPLPLLHPTPPRLALLRPPSRPASPDLRMPRSKRYPMITSSGPWRMGCPTPFARMTAVISEEGRSTMVSPSLSWNVTCCATWCSLDPRLTRVPVARGIDGRGAAMGGSVG